MAYDWASNLLVNRRAGQQRQNRLDYLLIEPSPLEQNRIPVYTLKPRNNQGPKNIGNLNFYFP